MLTLTDLVFMHSIHILVITTLYTLLTHTIEAHKWKKCFHDAPLKNTRDKKKKKKRREREMLFLRTNL